MKILFLLAGVASLFLSGLLQSVVAGERLQYDVIQASQKQRVTIYVQGSQAKIVSSADASSALIYNADNRQIHILDHTNKSVTTLDQASLEQLASIAQGMGEFAKSQGGVLGDIFKTMGLDNSMGTRAQIEIKTLSGEKKYSGQACQVQQVFSDGQLSTQICLAKNLAMQAKEKHTLDSLVSFAQLMLRQGKVILAQFSLPIPLLSDQPLQGLPVLIEDLSSNTTATLSGFKQMNLSPGQFALPSGYTRQVLSL